MLVIRAVSFKGVPMSQELLARFDESGGTIGRGEHSTLVLSDPDRYISRTHAIIAFQAGGFVITDNGTKNPITLNGRPMGAGTQARLSDGDEIKIGGYTLNVGVASQRVPQSPAADVGIGFGGKRTQDDPIAALGASPVSAPDPFADLMRPARPVPASPDPPRRSQGEPAIPRGPEIIPADALADLRGREPKIDEVLSLGPPAPPDRLGSEPRLGRAFPEPEPPRAVDPLDLLGGAARPIPSPTVPDHGPEVFTPYAPPAAKMDPALGFLPEPPPAVAPRDPSPPVQLPARGSAPRPAVSAATETALLGAFLRGAGIPDAHLPKGLTPETMETIGKILREAVQGTLDLLRVRGLTKSEMRADVTMIMPLDNNPLKFSPTVEAALVHLLAPHGHGFTAPLPAMKEAYDDLRAHQLGFLAGMRAALDEVLVRFAPEALQSRLSDQSVLDSLLPINRRAKLWDLFIERYETLAGEAREDYNIAFGKAFRRAYDAQVKQIRGEGRRE